VWDSLGPDGSSSGVVGQRLTGAGTPRTGKKLLLKTPPAGPAANKLVYLSKDPATALPAGVGEDPRCAPDGSGTAARGGTLGVAGTGGAFTILLPCANWSVNAAGTRYKYADPSGATCKLLLIKGGVLEKAVCKGAQVAYTLGAAQGDVGVVVTTGGELATERKACASFGPGTGATVVKDGSDGVTYKALNAGAPASCP
jgi:hypothetical protein